MPANVRADLELARRDLDAAMAGIREHFEWYADPEASWVSRLGSEPSHPDFPVWERPGMRELCTTWYAEGARQGTEGLVEDSVALILPWDFALADVRRPARIWWGEADTILDAKDGQFLVRALPEATLKAFPGEGHMFPVDHWAEMLEALA